MIEEKLLKEVENMSRQELENLITKIVKEVFSKNQKYLDSSTKTQHIVTKNDVRFSEKNISETLLSLGIPAAVKGFSYLKTSIIFYAEKQGKCKMTNELYPYVAKIHSTTPTRVERAIRHAIEISCYRGNEELIEKYFGYSVDPIKGKPKNSEFIASVVEYISRQN